MLVAPSTQYLIPILMLAFVLITTTRTIMDIARRLLSLQQPAMKANIIKSTRDANLVLKDVKNVWMKILAKFVLLLDFLQLEVLANLNVVMVKSLEG